MHISLSDRFSKKLSFIHDKLSYSSVSSLCFGIDHQKVPQHPNMIHPTKGLVNFHHNFSIYTWRFKLFEINCLMKPVWTKHYHFCFLFLGFAEKSLHQNPSFFFRLHLDISGRLSHYKSDFIRVLLALTSLAKFIPANATSYSTTLFDALNPNLMECSIEFPSRNSNSTPASLSCSFEDLSI